MITTMGKLEPTDLVKGSDGKWHNIEVLPIHIPKRMFEIEFTNGIVKCSGTHIWSFFKNTKVPWMVETEFIFENLSQFEDWFCGEINGPKIVSIKEIEPIASRCINVNNEDHLFEIKTIQNQDNKTFNVNGCEKIIKNFTTGDVINIKNQEIFINKISSNCFHITTGEENIVLTENDFFNFLCDLDCENKILTRNCQMRIVCGRLTSIPSMMAIGSTQATQISGSKPGAGMTSANGILEHVQYYFAPHDWLTKWFEKRGLNKKGFTDEQTDEKFKNYSELETEDELEFNEDITTIEFSGVSGTVDKTKNQKFEEI